MQISPFTPHSRRAFLIGASAATLIGPAHAQHGAELRLTLMGQSLIRYDLRRHVWPGLAPIRRRLRAAHVVFSNLEVAIRGPNEGAPTRAHDTLHVADPNVIDCLRDIGVTALSTSNNHAFDIGTGGIIDAIAALEARNMPFAGAGLDLARASAPGVQDTPAGRFAFVAFATGFVREGGMASDTRAGVNEVRRDETESLLEEDVERILSAISSARASGATVLVYQHNHYWERPNIERTPEWQRALARRCVDAGASVFAGHGPPLLHGMEIYNGAPIFYCLGSFIFQTKKEEDAYSELNWESLMVEGRFRDGRFVSADIRPIVLNDVGVGGPDDLETRGRPTFSTGARARATLERVEALSANFGFILEHNGRRARVTAPASAR
jgi:poly-gamma-glutamate capsule biosynthesis protein CapA/YwtB (metallophosphatase superfamily)